LNKTGPEGHLIMRSNKSNTLPEYKAPPPPPEPKKEIKTHETTLIEVLTAMRQHTPEQQNWIIAEVLKETAFDRYNTLMALKEDVNRAQNIFEDFLKLQSTGEKVLSEKSGPKLG
jgi:hypothetical protein